MLEEIYLVSTIKTCKKCNRKIIEKNNEQKGHMLQNRTGKESYVCPACNESFIWRWCMCFFKQD